MAPTRRPAVALVLLLLAAGWAPSVSAQVWCDDPPFLVVLTDESVAVSGLESEGHPSGYSWFVTPPGAPVPGEPSSRVPNHAFGPSVPGLWRVGLEVDYDHQATGGGLWSAQACITVEAASVVADLGLSATHVATDEDLMLSGSSSRWAASVVPDVEWQVDGIPFAHCNSPSPPASPAELACTVPAGWLAPGWHSAGLLLSDPASGQSSLATGDFEVIELVPLGVDFAWSPAHPDPGQLTRFVAGVVPSIPEEDLTLVVWDMGDGSVTTYTSCPPYYGSCLEMPYTYADDGWYDVTLTVETAEESASRSHRLEVGDPIHPPVASFSVSPASPSLLESASLTFTGSCEGGCTFAWDFGDGTHSSLAAPTHAWAVPTSFTVTLTATNDGGSDHTELDVPVSNCWTPPPPTQAGTCYGGPVVLTAASGTAWSWSTGAATQAIQVGSAGGFWVNVRSGASCWGHAAATVVLTNCGDPGGDANLDGSVDAADPGALVVELTDGDGDAVVGAGGGDLTAPGGDVTRDGRLRLDDLLTVLQRIYE
ncbi:MAG TPA: PKD domain-containing protein [Candidatus Sulfomarinibacteraceae bacterium]|nr:PKD domain-containing protein [Candidatus Sulfomarinibacteraceae bacterium]